MPATTDPPWRTSRGRHARLGLARALAARGVPDGARYQLAHAIEGLEACGVPRRVAEARDLARSLGLDNP